MVIGKYVDNKKPTFIIWCRNLKEFSSQLLEYGNSGLLVHSRPEGAYCKVKERGLDIILVYISSPKNLKAFEVASFFEWKFGVWYTKRLVTFIKFLNSMKRF